MLKLDLSRSNEELAGEITGRCSTLGQVIKVTVYQARHSPGPPARPFAIVSMATRPEAEAVAATFAGRTVGHSVIVFLEAAAKPASPPLSALAGALPDKTLGESV